MAISSPYPSWQRRYKLLWKALLVLAVAAIVVTSEQQEEWVSTIQRAVVGLQRKEENTESFCPVCLLLPFMVC
jgi:hypothetical protein